MKVSLVISTYNWPRALELCLQSVMNQRVLPDEILVADDGSGSETRRVIENFERISPVPLYHIWQPDEGFRLAAIRNKAIAASHYEYIIQIDGDLILDRNFICDHRATARHGYYVAGSRSIVSAPLTQRMMTEDGIRPSLLMRGVSNRLNAFRFPLLALFFMPVQKNYVRGCNMAFWRDDLLRINGYDENFEGWGSEDLDVAIRLMNAGVQRHTIKFRGIVYHLFHKSADRTLYAHNRKIVMESMETKRIRCDQGLNRYAVEATIPAGGVTARIPIYTESLR